MTWWMIALGAALIVGALIDVLWTTLWVDGHAGPLASRVVTWTWRGWRRLVGDHRHQALSLMGPLSLVLLSGLWVVWLWVGWTLVFASYAGALTSSSHARPFDWVDRLYFAGYSVFTLGNGDFAPARGVWQVLTVLATGSGLFMATLAVTYWISVISANVQKRVFASQIAGLGERPEDIVRLGWDGKGFSALEPQLNALTAQLSTLTNQHHAYPTLHYFHASTPTNATALAVAAFDEALTLLMSGVDPRVRPSDGCLVPARRAVDKFLNTLTDAYISPAAESPPAPDLGALRTANIPTVSEPDYLSAVAAEADRRKALLGLLDSDAREWPPCLKDK